jgi:hypothetical protein
MNKLAGLLLVAVAITVSGCTGSQASGPEIQTKDSFTIQGNSSKQFEIQVKNTFKERSASFTVNVTAPEIVDVHDLGSGEPVSSLEMGEATAGSKTVKRVIEVKGNPDRLGSLNSGTDQIELTASAQASGNISEAERFSRKNVTVTVGR